MAALAEGVQVLARKIQEGLMQGDVCARLRDAVNDYGRAQGMPWGCYYIDHDGDGVSGSCVFSCNGDVRMAKYEIGELNGKASCNIDFENSTNVVPVTTYQPEAEDGDHYTAMESAAVAAKTYTSLPVYERFISKDTRKAASSDSFAGKGRSFPILKAEDVSAALHSIGRAGPGNYSSDTIRANIKRIAKAKGFALPDSMKGEESVAVTVPLVAREANAPAVEALRKLFGTGDIGSICEVLKSRSQEAGRAIVSLLTGETLHDSTWKPDGTLLRESCKFSEAPRLAEAATTDYQIKLISPGRGSSGYYPFDVLKKAAESNVFKAGTQMFWNHDTDAEESARPEGDLDRLAAVTTTNAVWNKEGHDGPGLYARAKVFSDYADKVKEKGPHIGLSIRAGGTLDEGAVGPDGRKGVITALKNAASVDFVTKAGRDGKIFTESERAQEGEDMDKEAIQAMLKESVTAAVKEAIAPLQADNKRLTEALALQAAPRLIKEALADIRLPDASKKKILEKFTSKNVLAMLPMKEGEIDSTELGKLIEAEAVREKNFLMELGWGDGVLSEGVRLTEAELKAQEGKHETQTKEAVADLVDIFVGPARKGDELREAARESFMKGRIQ